MAKTNPRSAVISLRLTPDEHEALLEEATQAGITLSAFLRRTLATEVRILRQQRAIRNQHRHMVTGKTLGNPAEIEISYA